MADIFQRFVQKPSKRMYTIQNDEDHVSKKWRTVFLTFGTVYLKYTTWNPLSNAAFDNQRSPNVTLHLNKKHVLFQVERSEEVLKTAFSNTTEATCPPQLKKTFLERTQHRLGKFLFCSRNKSCFYKYSITQDSSNAGCKEPKKPNVAFEVWRSRNVTLHLNEKHVLFLSRDISGISQNNFFSYNQLKNQSRAQKDNFGTYSTSFWKVCVFLSVKSPIFFQTVCTKIIKTIAHNTKRVRPRFQKNQKLFF